jgi:hypothetical protein
MKILMKAVAGSHLFGTNTPDSDMDYKGIYIPSKKDMLLCKVESTLNIKRDKEVGEKNTKDDVDVELFTLQKFIKMLNEGQTVALELLFTPDHMIIEADPFWYTLRENWKEKFLTKKTTSFVGYCKTQADKYGVKGSRMAALKKAEVLFTKLFNEHDLNTKLKVVWDRVVLELGDTEGVHFDVQETSHGPIRYVQICEKKYQETQSIFTISVALTENYNKYGARAQAAERNEGIDWKALSHAYRVCCQAIELLETHHITLPLRDVDLFIVREAKLGKMDYNYFRPLLERKLEAVMHAEHYSKLNAEIQSEEFCEELVYNLYLHFLAQEDKNKLYK